MAPSTTFKQDLPPEGGYKKLDFSRIPAKQIWNWWTIIPAYCISTAVGLYLWGINRKRMNAIDLENNSATIAIMPLVIAEKDRQLLKYMRQIREEEDSLMKNVEGWETGTLYGEPIYKTKPEDEFIVPSVTEYYAQTREKELTKKNNFFHWF